MINAFLIDDLLDFFRAINKEQNEIEFVLSEHFENHHGNIALYDFLLKLFEDARNKANNNQIQILLMDNAMDNIRGLEGKTWISEVLSALEENDKLIELIQEISEKIPIAVFSAFEGHSGNLQNVLQSKLNINVYRVEKKDMDAGKYIEDIMNIVED